MTSHITIDYYKNDIISDFKNMSVKEVASKYGYDHYYVSQKLKEWGIPKNKVRVKLTDMQEKALISDYVNNIERVDILASKYFIRVRTVQRVLISNGVELRTQHQTKTMRRMKKC